METMLTNARQQMCTEPLIITISTTLFIKHEDVIKVREVLAKNSGRVIDPESHHLFPEVSDYGLFMEYGNGGVYLKVVHSWPSTNYEIRQVGRALYLLTDAKLLPVGGRLEVHDGSTYWAWVVTENGLREDSGRLFVHWEEGEMVLPHGETTKW